MSEEKTQPIAALITANGVSCLRCSHARGADEPTCAKHPRDVNYLGKSTSLLRFCSTVRLPGESCGPFGTSFEERA